MHTEPQKRQTVPLGQGKQLAVVSGDVRQYSTALGSSRCVTVLSELVACLNVVRYASQALLVTACEATLPRCSDVPHICGFAAAKAVEKTAKGLMLAQKTCTTGAEVLSTWKALCYSNEYT
jgi:hypothetical protein